MVNAPFSLWTRCAFDGSFRPDMEGISGESSAQRPNLAQAQNADWVYELYCKYAEESRAALLRVIQSASVRRFLCEDPAAISREEFLQQLARMSSAQRNEFIDRMALGYDADIAASRDQEIRFRRSA